MYEEVGVIYNFHGDRTFKAFQYRWSRNRGKVDPKSATGVCTVYILGNKAQAEKLIAHWNRTYEWDYELIGEQDNARS